MLFATISMFKMLQIHRLAFYPLMLFPNLFASFIKFQVVASCFLAIFFLDFLLRPTQHRHKVFSLFFLTRLGKQNFTNIIAVRLQSKYLMTLDCVILDVLPWLNSTVTKGFRPTKWRLSGKFASCNIPIDLLLIALLSASIKTIKLLRRIK